MKHLVLTLALTVGASACGLLGGRPEPVPITTAGYQPYGAEYRGVSVGRTTQYFDEQPTETVFGLEYFTSSIVTAAVEGLVATLVLDSILLFDDAMGGVTGAQADSARGATYRADMAPTGRLTGFLGGEISGSLARELADRVLKPFFPILPERGAQSGSTWADTIDTQMVVNGLETNIRSISEYSALDWGLHAGERALHIFTLSNYSFNGTGIQAGREFTIEGTGRRHLHRYLSESGRYLGLVSTDTSDAEARLADLDIVIPIHQTRVDSLSIR
jgi:hypothetical protein